MDTMQISSDRGKTAVPDDLDLDVTSDDLDPEVIDALAAVHALVLKGWHFTITRGPKYTQTKVQNGPTYLFAMSNNEGATVFFPPSLNERDMKPFVNTRALRHS
jgi:hypothetical protein